MTSFWSSLLFGLTLVSFVASCDILPAEYDFDCIKKCSLCESAPTVLDLGFKCHQVGNSVAFGLENECKKSNLEDPKHFCNMESDYTGDETTDEYSQNDDTYDGDNYSAFRNFRPAPKFGHFWRFSE